MSSTDAQQPAAKRARSTPLIATHSGTFHCDESLAVFLLRLLPAYRDSSLVRTRDSKLLADADIVVDVGGEYEPSKHRYDHHQKGFTEVFGGKYDKTKLSSAGLVYKHFGKDIFAELYKLDPSSPEADNLHQLVYGDFVEALDGIDNGISCYSGKPAYHSKTDLSSRVGALNPRWNEPCNDAILDERFAKASEMTGQEFLQRVDYIYKAWLPARGIVEDMLNKRFDVHPSGKIMVMETFAPWKDHLFLLEEEKGVTGDVKPLYVLYPDESGKWRIQAVPESPDSFASRLALPEPWRGVRDEQLSQLSGIDGCVFVHASGFIGGNATREGAYAMATKALAFA